MAYLHVVQRAQVVEERVTGFRDEHAFTRIAKESEQV
jgi:hypothetical protein